MNKMSSLERVVASILAQENIVFEREKTFKDCYNGLYRFDFYLPQKNVIFEVQGEQHYTFVKSFYKNKSDFTKAKERDRRKISYCLAHGIKIYCIPYWEIQNLKNYNDLIQKKFLARSKFHNDEVMRQQKFEK